MGTAGYMSPEQVRGQSADVRSDIFSFGSILFEMATGRRAFRAASTIETLVAILREEPAFPSAKGPPAAVLRVARRCLEKNPQERFQSARDLAYALQELLASPEGSDATEPRSVKKRSYRPDSFASSAGDRRRRRADSDAREDSGFRLRLEDREVPLRVGVNVIGRGRDATIRLHEKSISRHHARIVVRDAEVLLEDLDSKNGTFLHGERIGPPTRLEDGDTFRLGSVSMTLRMPPDTGSTDTQSPT
jgi:serine/threonine protein kinase